MNDSNMDVSYQISRQKIILTGDVAVGKTSIINTLLGNKFTEEYEPSIGVDFFSKTMNYKGKQIKLQIWDSAGQEKFRSLIPNYIRGASLIFLVYDITNQQSFTHLPDWIKFINNIENTNIVIVGNKIDLDNKRVITFEEGKKFAEENNYEIYEVSAKEGTGLFDMLFNSLASLPIFDSLNNQKMTKEEIIEALKNENFEKFEERKINEETVEKAFDTDKNKEKSREIINNNNNTTFSSDLNKNLYTVDNTKKKCCL
jgi:Ras-related protein Rab-6A